MSEGKVFNIEDVKKVNKYVYSYFNTSNLYVKFIKHDKESDCWLIIETNGKH